MQYNCPIPTAIPMFSRLTISTKLSPIFCYAIESRKSKMAARKQGMLISQVFIQRCYTIPMISVCCILMCWYEKLRWHIFEIVQCKQTSPIQNGSSQTANNYNSACIQYTVAAKKNGCTHISKVQEFNETKLFNVWCMRKKIQDIG